MAFTGPALKETIRRAAPAKGEPAPQTNTPTAAPAKAPAKAPVPADELKFINAANNPANNPLPGGLQADPTYLSFLRGIGFTQANAYQTALQNLASARSAYETQASRLPQQLSQAQEATDTGVLDRGVYDSGERLDRENKNVVANQQAGQDLLSARASAEQQALQGFQGTIAQLQQQQADAVGGLQDRRQQEADQQKYINQVAGGGGGGTSVTISGGTVPVAPPAPAATAPAPPKTQGPDGTTVAPNRIVTPASAQPAMAQGENIGQYLSTPSVKNYYDGLDAPGKQNFLTFIKAQYPTADLSGYVGSPTNSTGFTR